MLHSRSSMARIRRSDWLQIGFWSMRHNLLCGAFLCFVVPTRISVGAPVCMHRSCPAFCFAWDNPLPRPRDHRIIDGTGQHPNRRSPACSRRLMLHTAALPSDEDSNRTGGTYRAATLTVPAGYSALDLIADGVSYHDRVQIHTDLVRLAVVGE